MKMAELLPMKVYSFTLSMLEEILNAFLMYYTDLYFGSYKCIILVY